MGSDRKTPSETARRTPAAPEVNRLYFDDLHDTEEDMEDIKKANEKKATKGDVVYLSVVSALILAVIAVMAVYMSKTGKSDPVNYYRRSAQEQQTADAEQATLAGYFSTAAAFANELTVSTGGTQFPNGIQQSFRTLYAANNDVVGWIRVNNTSIDYPVVKGHETSNASPEYERKNFYGETSRRGSIWMDYRNRVAPSVNGLSKVTVIYGHHLSTDACIFAELEKYMDVAFYKQNPVIEFNTIYKNYKWKVIGCIVTNADPEDDDGRLFYYWDPYIKDAETLGYVNEVLIRSYFRNPAVDVVPTDKLLCLSTCTFIMNRYTYKEMRCVVVARMVRDGESEAVDVSNAVANPNRRMPQYWYTLNETANPYANVPVFSAS